MINPRREDLIKSLAIAQIQSFVFQYLVEGNLAQSTMKNSIKEKPQTKRAMGHHIAGNSVPCAVMIGAFNLVPAFPLDGGRVLLAGLIRWKKDYHDATKIATTVGVLISYIFMGFGFVILFSGDFPSNDSKSDLLQSNSMKYLFDTIDDKLYCKSCYDNCKYSCNDH